MGVTFGGESQFLGATLLVGLFQIARSLACLFGSQRPILTGATPAPPGPGHWPALVRARAPLGPACARSHRAPLSARIFSSRASQSPSSSLAGSPHDAEF